MNNQQIIQAITDNNGFVIDDHGSGTEQAKLFGVAEHIKGNKRQLVALFGCRAFCLNEVYLDAEGKPHLSKWSVGGTVYDIAEDLKESVENYNQSLTFGSPTNQLDFNSIVIFNNEEALCG